jgi:hypothetical protein
MLTYPSGKRIRPRTTAFELDVISRRYHSVDPLRLGRNRRRLLQRGSFILDIHGRGAGWRTFGGVAPCPAARVGVRCPEVEDKAA